MISSESCVHDHSAAPTATGAAFLWIKGTEPDRRERVRIVGKTLGERKLFGLRATKESLPNNDLLAAISALEATASKA